ncbi:hypothetical protein ACMHYB_01970 [Sorangium sp. So ce1128]
MVPADELATGSLAMMPPAWSPLLATTVVFGRMEPAATSPRPRCTSANSIAGLLAQAAPRARRGAAQTG